MYYRWKNEDIEKLQYLVEIEGLSTKEIHDEHLSHIPIDKIKRKKDKSGFSTKGWNWTKEEITFLEDNWGKMPTHEVYEKLIKRTSRSINRMVSKLGLKKDKDIRYSSIRKNNLEILKNRSCQSLYWIGFFFADGSFSNDGGIEIEISNKDKDHLKKFYDYVGVGRLTYRRKNICYGSCDVSLIEYLKENFDLKKAKTYNPPNLENVFSRLSDKEILSFIIGFIDGDGNIRDEKITLENHKSWEEDYVSIRNFVSHIFNVSFKKRLVRKNTKGYIVMTFSQKVIFQNLKSFAINEKLPILQRKWS
jgi:DNA-binding transcriptional regulator WhiA